MVRFSLLLQDGFSDVSGKKGAGFSAFDDVIKRFRPFPVGDDRINAVGGGELCGLQFGAHAAGAAPGTCTARKSIDRLSELRALDSSYSEVMDEVTRRLDAAIGSPEIRKVLVSWIAEAAIGLDRKEAKVAFSDKTPVTEDMLREAEDEVRRITGSSVSLSLDPDRLIGGGVSVSSMDGKVSYNNQLDVRIRRFQRDIKRIIQEENARENSR